MAPSVPIQGRINSFAQEGITTSATGFEQISS